MQNLETENTPRVDRLGKKKILLFANTDWYLYNFRLSLARAIQAMDLEVVLVSPPGKYGARMASEGFRWIPFPLDRAGMNPFVEAWKIVRLVQLYRKERPDLVHHYTVKCVLYGSIAAWLTGVRAKINAITGLGHLFTDEGWRARAARRLVCFLYFLIFRSRSNRTTFENMDDYRLFIEKGLIDSKQARLIRGSGIDIQKFKPHSAASSAKLVVLMATRLLWEKGVSEYVEAARICRAQADVQFWLAGEPDPGNPSAVSQQEIAAWRAAGTVVVLGHVDDMAGLLRQAHIVVLPSYREGTPRILLEAAACGLPIVATDVPGCREVVVHEVNGFLVPPKNSGALAASIMRLIEDPSARHRMGQAGRAKVIAEFDQDLVLRKTLAIYRELLDTRVNSGEK